MSFLSGDGKTKTSPLMENKVLRPFLCLAVVLCSHGDGLVRFSFPTISIWMLVGLVFSHDESGEGVDDEVDDVIGGTNFIMFTCGVLAVYSSFAKVMGMRMTAVDGEMALFVQIGACVRGISVWDDDPRWWNLWLFQGFLSPINGVGVVWFILVMRGYNLL